jgi:hypothetical protein
LGAQSTSTYEYVVFDVRDGATARRPILVSIDFGPEAEQRQEAILYTRELEKTRTRAGVLNYMAERGFELVEAMVEPIQRTTGPYERPVFHYIMRREKASAKAPEEQ